MFTATSDILFLVVNTYSELNFIVAGKKHTDIHSIPMYLDEH